MSKFEGFRWQERDGKILEAIYLYDGLLTEHQINRLFFNTALRTVYARLEKLEKAGFIARPEYRQRMQLQGHTVYWLTRLGIEYVASAYGASVKELHWRKPGDRWSETRHDVLINDFRIAVVQGCDIQADLQLKEWISSRDFAADYDRIEYFLPAGQHKVRGILPDGYFVIQDGDTPSARFLLEIDRGTLSHNRIARDKLHAGVAYIKSDAYRQRFGYNAGRWLLVTTDQARRTFMQATAERELGRSAVTFYFTTFDQITPQAVLTQSIWYRGSEPTPTALFQRFLQHGSGSV